ncbi:MAG: zinc-ribbon domain-containing protein [Candidatus Nanopelagicales bacterium]
MNKFCTSCGDELVPGNLFCGSCGAPIDDPEPGLGESAGPTNAPVGAAQPSGGGTAVLQGMQKKIGNTDLIQKVRAATTKELAKDAALRAGGSWVAIWVVIAFLTQVGVVIIDTGDLSINGASLASVIMALGFGGSVTASGEGSMYFGRGDASVWIHYAPFFVALGYAVVLRLAFTYKATRRSEAETMAAGLVSALSVAVVTLVSTIFGSITISGLLEQEFDVESSLGLTWFLPVVCAAVLTGFVVSWPVIATGWTRFRDSLCDLTALFTAVFVLLVVAGLATILYFGVRVATGAVELEFWPVVGGLAGAILFIPNAVVSALSLLTGAQAGAELSAAGAASIAEDVLRDLPDEPEKWGLPAVVVLLAFVVLLIALVALWRINSSRESKSAWWENACSFGVVGLVLTYFGSLHGFANVSVETYVGSTSADIGYMTGFNALDVAFRLAIVGAIIGAARHPVVLAKIRPVGEPIGQQLSPVFAAITAKVKGGPAMARLSRSSENSPEIADIHTSSPSPKNTPKVVQGVVAVGLGVAALLVAIPVSLVLGKGLLVASGVLTDSPNDIVAQVEATIRDGDGRALSDMLGLSDEVGSSSDSRVLSSTGGVEGVSGSLDEDTGGDYVEGDVTFRVGGTEGSIEVMIEKQVDGGPLGLVPVWELVWVGGLPEVYGTTTAVGGSMVDTAVRVDGVDLPADVTSAVMPGTLDAAAVSSANPEWVTGSVMAPVQAVGESVAIPVTYTVTPAGNTEAAARTGQVLAACGTTSDSPGCPYDFGCWSTSPTNPALYGAASAVGPNAVAVPTVPGALKYGQESYVSACTPSSELTAPVNLTVTSSGMAAQE